MELLDNRLDDKQIAHKKLNSKIKIRCNQFPSTKSSAHKSAFLPLCAHSLNHGIDEHIANKCPNDKLKNLQGKLKSAQTN